MKVLQIHKNHRPFGGTEKYYLELSELLTEKGHEVAYFSMKHPKNIPSKWEKYFVSKISFKDVNIFDGPKILYRMVYALDAKRQISKLLDEFKPDVAHVHNIYYHISPSILAELKKRSIPVVYTVHDYHLLTPNVTFYHGKKNCEFAKGTDLYNQRWNSLLFFKAVIHKCVKDSYLASFVAAFTLFIHYALGIYQGSVDYFIAPSKFMRNKLLEYGFDRKKVIYLPNFLDLTGYFKSKKSREGNKKYVLFFGLFHQHKGVEVLLRAAIKLPNISFRIAGSGSEEKHLKDFVKTREIKNVRFLGYLNSEKLKKEISSSMFCVVPSLWYENMPYSVLEAFALGKPVVASRIGGIPEIVGDKKDGLLFKPGDANDLSQKIKKLWNSPKLVEKMGRKARKKVLHEYSIERHYKKLMDIYRKAIDKT